MNVQFEGIPHEIIENINRNEMQALLARSFTGIPIEFAVYEMFLPLKKSPLYNSKIHEVFRSSVLDHGWSARNSLSVHQNSNYAP